MPTWDELYAAGYVFGEPLAWIRESLQPLLAAGTGSVLDVGCGTGRHLVWLEQHGFAAWGTEISPHGLRQSREALQLLEAPVRLALADMRSLPFGAATFDAIVSTQVLYHATRAGMQTALAEIERVLRPGGLFVGSFLSTRTWKYGEGERLERDTFVQPRGPEAGVPHHYCDEDEVRSLLSNFKLLALHLDEYRDEAGQLQSHWEVRAQRSG